MNSNQNDIIQERVKVGETETVKSLLYSELTKSRFYIPLESDTAITVEAMLRVKETSKFMLPNKHELIKSRRKNRPLVADMNYAFKLLQMFLIENFSKILPFETAPSKQYLTELINYYDPNNTLKIQYISADDNILAKRRSLILSRRSQSMTWDPERHKFQATLNKLEKRELRICFKHFHNIVQVEEDKKVDNMEVIQSLFNSLTPRNQTIFKDHIMPISIEAHFDGANFHRRVLGDDAIRWYSAFRERNIESCIAIAKDNRDKLSLQTRQQLVMFDTSQVTDNILIHAFINSVQQELKPELIPVSTNIDYKDIDLDEKSRESFGGDGNSYSDSGKSFDFNCDPNSLKNLYQTSDDIQSRNSINEEDTVPIFNRERNSNFNQQPINSQESFVDKNQNFGYSNNYSFGKGNNNREFENNYDDGVRNSDGMVIESIERPNTNQNNGQAVNQNIPVVQNNGYLEMNQNQNQDNRNIGNKHN